MNRIMSDYLGIFFCIVLVVVFSTMVYDLCKSKEYTKTQKIVSATFTIIGGIFLIVTAVMLFQDSLINHIY